MSATFEAIEKGYTEKIYSYVIIKRRREKKTRNEEERKKNIEEKRGQKITQWSKIKVK